MVRKRRRHEEDVKPWCFYCDREFQDEATLITHQKGKHFKCETCHKRLMTVKALAVHSLQVHKQPVATVPDALPGRDSMEYDVFGMAGVPAGMVRGGEVPSAAPEPAVPAPSPAGYPPPGIAPPGMAPPGMAPPMAPAPGAMPPGPYGAYRPPPQQPLGYGAYPRPAYGQPPHYPGYGGPPPYGGYGAPPRPAPGYAPPYPPPPGAGAVHPLPPAAPHAGAAGPPQPFPATVGGAVPPGGAQQQQATNGGAGAPAPDPAPADAGLVWKEEGVSMEERRAALPLHAKHVAGVVVAQLEAVSAHPTKVKTDKALHTPAPSGGITHPASDADPPHPLPTHPPPRYGGGWGQYPPPQQQYPPPQHAYARPPGGPPPGYAGGYPQPPPHPY